MPSPIRVKRPEQKSKEPHPIWRGVGCLMLVIMTVGAYAVSGPIISLINGTKRLPFQIPNKPTTLIDRTFSPPLKYFPFPEWGIALPTSGEPLAKSDDGGLLISSKRFVLGFSMLQAVFALFVAILFFGIFGIVWGIMNPPKLGPHDAPPVDRKIDKSKVR